MGGQRHAPAALPPREIRYPLYRRLGGPQVCSGREQKISLQLGFDLGTVQHVASSYKDRSIPTTVIIIIITIIEVNSPCNKTHRPRGYVDYSSTLSLTTALDGGGWSTSRTGRFTSGKDPLPIIQEAGWPQGRSGWVRKISPPPGFQLRTVKPVANRCTD